jgi:hypothetical protein
MSLYIGTSPKKLGHAKKIILQQESILLNFFRDTQWISLQHPPQKKGNTNIDHHMGWIGRVFVVHYFLYFII